MANARRASSPAPLWTRLELRDSESKIFPDHRSMSGHAPARARRLGFSLVAAAAICWSTGGLITRLVTTDPWTTVFWRSVFCSAFLAVALCIAHRGRIAAVCRETGWPGVLMAACFATASTCFIMALARTSVADTLIIQSLSPFIAGLGGWLCLGERVRRRTWAAMGAAFIGTVVMLWGSPSAGSRVGDALALVTATAFAAATVVVRWRRGVPMPAAAALAAALAASLAVAAARPAFASTRDLVLLALFGSVQLGGGLLLFTAGARLIPVAEASLIGVLESVLGPVWVWLAIGEYPGAFSLLGGAVILFALIAHMAADLARPSPVPGEKIT
ncbi:MAG: EamA family transporter [Candidatus Rokuibacteriota bacterium]|nr:MAG: EamA family transporter [Candidatus Rokubacteria bacterium]